MNDKKKWIIGGSVVIILFILGASIMLSTALNSKSKKNSHSTTFGEPVVAIVRVEGAIMASEETVSQINEIKSNKNVKALLLRIDSPGGAVAPSQEIYEAVNSFRKSGRKVVVSMGSVAASGGFYIACAADTIIANPGTITGSIGVIFSFPYFESLFKKIGVDMEVIKSGPYKDAGSPHRSLTSGERKVFQSVIDDTWDQFVEVVATGRGLDTAYVRSLADGRIFTGRQAAKLKLIDKLGSFDEAKIFTKKIAAVDMDSELFEFQPEKKFIDYILGSKISSMLSFKESLLPSGVSYIFSR